MRRINITKPLSQTYNINRLQLLFYLTLDGFSYNFMLWNFSFFDKPTTFLFANVIERLNKTRQGIQGLLKFILQTEAEKFSK